MEKIENNKGKMRNGLNMTKGETDDETKAEEK
jgi:hypothetical protein